MKKLFFMLALGLLATTSFAQTKGDIAIGGIISADVYNGNYIVAPGVQYSVSDKFAAGIGVGYMRTLAEVEEFDSKKTTAIDQLLIAPSIKYYHKLADKFYYTPEFGFGYAFGNGNYFAYYRKAIGDSNQYETSTPNSDFKSKTISLALSILDFEFRPSKRIGLGLSCGSATYTINNNKGKVTTDVYDNIEGKYVTVVNDETISNKDFKFDLLGSYVFSIKFYL